MSDISFQELEYIATSNRYNEEIKYKARKTLSLLKQFEDKYISIPYSKDWDIFITSNPVLFNNNDTRILITALQTDTQIRPEKLVFRTHSQSMERLAKSMNLATEYIESFDTNYTGFQILKLDTDEKLAHFYENMSSAADALDLYNNEYLIVENADGEIIDKYKMSLGKLMKVPYVDFDSYMFGKVRPKDVYQQCAMDSIAHNQLTVMRGPAGSGKSLLGLAYLFQELDKGHIQRIVMFVNPVATKNSCKFGFLPGTLQEKILGSEIGFFLSSKLGDMTVVEKLIADDKLRFVPLADARGLDLGGLNAGIYLTEAQNTTIDMMKLLLQRLDSHSVCIIEGDDKTQVDMDVYAGRNNGLTRLSEVFRGEDYYGEITLQNCYRSPIAARAEQM